MKKNVVSEIINACLKKKWNIKEHLQMYFRNVSNTSFFLHWYGIGLVEWLEKENRFPCKLIPMQ